MRKPKLVWNWRTILKRAWSVRLATIAAVLSAIEAVLTQISGIGESPSQGWIPVAAALCGGAAVIARIVDQATIPKEHDNA